MHSLCSVNAACIICMALPGSRLLGIAPTESAAQRRHEPSPGAPKLANPRFAACNQTSTAMAQQNGDSSEPSSRAPVAFPDFRLFDSAQDILDHNKCGGVQGRALQELRAPSANNPPSTRPGALPAGASSRSSRSTMRRRPRRPWPATACSSAS